MPLSILTVGKMAHGKMALGKITLIIITQGKMTLVITMLAWRKSAY